MIATLTLQTANSITEGNIKLEYLLSEDLEIETVVGLIFEKNGLEEEVWDNEEFILPVLSKVHKWKRHKFLTNEGILKKLIKFVRKSGEDINLDIAMLMTENAEDLADMYEKVQQIKAQDQNDESIGRLSEVAEEPFLA